MCSFFFFQAEDGIRDLVRSRGLGDVYKRQVDKSKGVWKAPANVTMKGVNDIAYAISESEQAGSVSYTHLTLPTSDLV